ncbi:phosphatase PAP2 family protein [Mycobacterium sp. NPDC003449]
MGTRASWLSATAVAAVGLYAVLWIGYRLRWLTALDDAGLGPAYRYGTAHPGWIAGWDAFCTVLGPFGFRVAVLVVMALLLVRRRYRIVLFLLLTVQLSGIVTEIAKGLADRPRPDTAMVHALSTSFPSGHALGVLVSVLALLTVAWPVLRAPLRGWLVALGAVVVVAIGVGRVVLNVHHPSDVLAGWALGYAFFVLVVVLLPPGVSAVDETPAGPGSRP